MFEWDRQGALALFGEYKAFWGPSKNAEFGITGRPDANTRKVNAKSVYLSVENHGRVGMSRKNIDFSGGGAILEKLLSFLAISKSFWTSAKPLFAFNSAFASILATVLLASTVFFRKLNIKETVSFCFREIVFRKVLPIATATTS